MPAKEARAPLHNRSFLRPLFPRPAEKAEPQRAASWGATVIALKQDSPFFRVQGRKSSVS